MASTSLSRTLLSAGGRGNINLWPLDSPHDLSISQIESPGSGRPGWIWRLILVERTDSSLVVALSGRPSDIHFFDVASQSGLSGVCSGHTDHIHDIVYAPPTLTSSGLLFSSSSDLTVCVWKRPEVLGKKNFERVGIFDAHEGAVYGVNYARESDEATLFSCAFRVILWNLNRCIPVQLSPKRKVKADSIVRLPDRGLLAVGYSNGGPRESCVEFFDQRDLCADDQPKLPHFGCEVSSLLYLEERNQLIVTHRAGKMQYWDVRATSRGPVLDFQAHRYSMFGILRVGKDRIATASNDDTVRLWKLCSNHASTVPARTFSDLGDQYGLCHCGGPIGIGEVEELIPEDAEERLEFAETVSSCWNSVRFGGGHLRFPACLVLISS